MTGDRLLLVLVGEYVVLSIFYIAGGQWAKATYFIGAAILSVGVLFMK